MAFLVPSAIRTVPEVLAWPYPIGFDTLIYINIISKGTYLKTSLASLLKSASLFFLLSSTANLAFQDPIITVKIFGPLLFGLLCSSIYIYAKRGLRWSAWKALAASIIGGTYFVSLRISWEMYRQMLGLTFLMLGLTGFRISRLRLKVLVVALFGFLATWSHQLAAVLFLTISATYILVKRQDGARSKALMALAIAPALLLFLYQIYSPAAGELRVPYEKVAASSRASLAAFISGFLGYMFLPLLPLIALGALTFRSIDVWVWLATCLVFTYWPVLLPEYSVLFWFRWAILLVYPMTFMSVEGGEKLWKLGAKIFWKFKVGTLIALAVLTLNLVMSGYYLTGLPEHQIKYFGEWNHYKRFIQTSMLQNSVSLSDTPNVVKALKWFKEEAAEPNSVLVLHEAMGYWAQILLHDVRIVMVKERGLSSQVRENAAVTLAAYAEDESRRGNEVYSVWWVNGKGWYGMPELSHQFKEVQRFGDIAVFRYVQSSSIRQR